SRTAFGKSPVSRLASSRSRPGPVAPSLISPGLRNDVNASSRTFATRRRYSIAAAGAAPSAASASAARAMALRDLIMAHLLDASKYTAAVEQRSESLRFERRLCRRNRFWGWLGGGRATLFPQSRGSRNPPRAELDGQHPRCAA